VSDRALRLTIAVVAVAGTAVSAYLTYVHYNPAALVCTRGGGCETVQQSHYAVLLGVPLALYGVATWTSVLVLTLWDQHAARTVVAALALSALGFSVYLVVLQLAVINAVCWWCMGNDVVLVPALALLSSYRFLHDAA
jgi:uncharacterized membrane protein